MFQRTATRLKRKLWWQNIKLWIILIIIILVVLAVIISKLGSHYDIIMTSYMAASGRKLVSSPGQIFTEKKGVWTLGPVAS